MNEVDDDGCGEVRDLDNIEGLLVASFSPTDRGVGDRLDKERSVSWLEDRRGSSFRDEEVEGVRSMLDELLD